MGLFVVYLVVSYFIFFEAVAPVANFHFKPIIQADSPTYWAASGVRPTNFVDRVDVGADASSNLFGPVLEAELLRTDFNVALFNSLLFVFCLSILRSMPQFDRGTFLLLMMMNPFLILSMITLNKEIFALAGMVVFIRYTEAKRFRAAWLALALTLSLFARWEQVVVLLLYVAYESKLSPLRGRRRWGVAITVLGFTVGYALIYRLIPLFFAALLAQAEAGHTIVLLDNIQANFGFPVVAIPKIMMNCLGRFITPVSFLQDYFVGDFTNWIDQIIMPMHTLLLSALLMGLFLSRKLRLQHAPVYVLVLYLLMTAVSPAVQPRYEYPVYILLCLEASRYFRLRERYPSSTTAASTHSTRLYDTRAAC